MLVRLMREREREREREYNISHVSICIVADLLSVSKLLRTSFLLGEMLRGSIRLVDSQAVS